ncbi:class I SAM-dependent methyltransferase [Bradyrhizobium sp.]|uniref:class I SAM-dependent methyltransferase n=1 Tax=Bradyrhizobium sp. TaxID=376 RepID=UPI002619E24C|nr:class I SAM-dependent methyltransferase [Bradyrhizobium sp.]
MDAPQGHEKNADQIAYWNGPGGQRWVDRQASQDILLRPVVDLLIDRARITPGEQILDIGCGSGATSRAFAERTGRTGHVTAVDISAPMLARARELAPPDAPIDFILADATVHPFPPDRFDLLASRFGVMFFADPAISFTNMHRAMRRTGRVTFACWREPRENPFFMVPLQAVYRHVPKMPPVGPDEPGPFAFASAERVRRILTAAGFSGIAMEPCNLSFDMAIGQGLEAAVKSGIQMGPASRALTDQPAEIVAAATQSVRDALAPYAKGPSVPLDGAIWIVTAKA